MHIPGHNPYITEEFTPLGQSTTAWTTPLFESPYYSYSGINPEIMSALSNVLMLGDEPLTGFNLFDNLTYTGALNDLLPPGAIASEGIEYGEMPFQGTGYYYDWGNVLPHGFQHITDTGQTAQYNANTGTWYEAGTGASLDTPSEYQDFFMGEFDAPEGLEGSTLPFTDVFDPESLAATLTSLGGLDPSWTGQIRAGEVKALTPEMIEKTESQYYDPVEDVGREKLIREKTKALGKAKTGGFAGSGARASGLSGAEQVYRGGYGKLLEEIMGMQAGATEDVMDTIYGWQELLGNQ